MGSLYYDSACLLIKILRHCFSRPCHAERAVPDTLDGTGDVYHISGLPWRNGHGLIQCEADSVAREAQVGVARVVTIGLPDGVEMGSSTPRAAASGAGMR